jgi:hypothetical protein
MSMSSNPQEFDDVRRLIALKRYEQPHPRYFNDFSSKVIARIQAGEHAHLETSGLLSLLPGWVARLWSALEARPTWAGIAGFGACALVVSGFIASEPVGTPVSDIPQVPETSGLLVEQSVQNPMPAEQRATFVSFGGSMGGVPSSQPQGSLFEQFRSGQRQTWQNLSFQGH